MHWLRTAVAQYQKILKPRVFKIFGKFFLKSWLEYYKSDKCFSHFIVLGKVSKSICELSVKNSKKAEFCLRTTNFSWWFSGRGGVYKGEKNSLHIWMN